MHENINNVFEDIIKDKHCQKANRNSENVPCQLGSNMHIATWFVGGLLSFYVLLQAAGGLNLRQN